MPFTTRLVSIDQAFLEQPMTGSKGNPWDEVALHAFTERASLFLFPDLVPSYNASPYMVRDVVCVLDDNNVEY